MIDNNSDISVTRLDTGDIAYIRYDKTDDYPRLADRLRATAYDQANDLTDALDKTLYNTIEQLHEEQGDLTSDEQARLNEIYTTMHRAHTALKDTVSALWEWHLAVDRIPKRLAQIKQKLSRT